MMLIALLALLGWIYLGFFHGWFWRVLLEESSPTPDAWPSVDIIVPARDEAEALPRSLPSLLAQDYPGAWRIILVDDHSKDGTSAIVRGIAAHAAGRLTVIAAPDLPAGWSGKLAALQAGAAQSRADYILFTDADIAHPADSLRRLVSCAIGKNLDLVSRMVKLHCQSAAEKLLIPAFVFFFAMLYPFRRVNDPAWGVAAGAGGVMLVRRRALDQTGGLARIRSALIDDCALAKAIKERGGANEASGRIELTLTRDIHSLRPYPRIADIWRMIARTAYTQLRHSPWLLAGTVLGMAILFLAPVFLFIAAAPLSALLGLVAWMMMSVFYVPIVRFYGLPFFWAPVLPAAAVIYVAATIDSARLYWQGRGGQWKGRLEVRG